MANHLQDQILASIRATLIAADIVESGRVYLEGVDEIPAEATPAIKVDAGPETIANLTLRAPRTQKRTLDVFVTIVVAQNDDYRLQAGRLLARVEEAISATPETRSAGGISPDGLQLAATDPDRDGNAAKVVYSIRTLWRVTYLCKEGAPDRTRAASRTQPTP